MRAVKNNIRTVQFHILVHTRVTRCIMGAVNLSVCAIKEAKAYCRNQAVGYLRCKRYLATPVSVVRLLWNVEIIKKAKRVVVR